MEPSVRRQAPANRPYPPDTDQAVPAEQAPTTRRNSAQVASAVMASALVFIAGIWLIIAPFSLDYRNTGGEFSGYWNDVVIGVALAAVALVRIVSPVATAPLSVINVLLGMWLIIAPFILGYNEGADAAAATVNDIIVGVLVVLLATVSLLSGRSAEGGTNLERAR
jgi:hypothetical protein